MFIVFTDSEVTTRTQSYNQMSNQFYIPANFGTNSVAKIIIFLNTSLCPCTHLQTTVIWIKKPKMTISRPDIGHNNVKWCLWIIWLQRQVMSEKLRWWDYTRDDVMMTSVTYVWQILVSGPGHIIVIPVRQLVISISRQPLFDLVSWSEWNIYMLQWSNWIEDTHIVETFLM